MPNWALAAELSLVRQLGPLNSPLNSPFQVLHLHGFPQYNGYSSKSEILYTHKCHA